jgi:hypothetical protein
MTLTFEPSVSPRSFLYVKRDGHTLGIVIRSGGLWEFSSTRTGERIRLKPAELIQIAEWCNHKNEESK